MSKEKIPKKSELSLTSRILLKAISKVQICLLKLPNAIAVDTYYKLAEWHFYIYFKRDLAGAVLAETVAGDMAVTRHGRLVIKALFSDKEAASKGRLAAAARGVFIKNLILNMEL